MTEFVGVKKRTIAYLIDTALFLPLGLIYVWSRYESDLQAMCAAVLVSAAFPAYMIALHGLRGQSLGKMIVGIRVGQINGDRLSWKASLVRHIPLLVLQVLSGVGIACAIYRVPHDFLIAPS